ncbi:class I fructose-bisphosphate aldolase [soil metagenome]
MGFSGHQFRLGRLFQSISGRSFITAMDHGVTLGVPDGMSDVPATVEKIIAGQPDGVLMGPGIFQKTSQLFAHREAPAVILRSDFFVNHPYVDFHGEAYRTLITPEDAAIMGADAIIMFLMLGSGGKDMFADNVHAVARFTQEAHKVGLPMIVEAVLWGSNIEEKKDPQRLAFCCRMAVEIGADAIKTEYTGDKSTMADVINGTPAPVLVLGGTKSSSPGGLIQSTRDAMQAGAKGVIYGRNVWQAEDPVSISQDLRSVIHATPAGA